MVKRYTLWDDFGPIDPWDNDVDDSGDWVLHEDYAALEARVAELEKDAARYRALVDSGKYCPSFGSGYWGLRTGGFGRSSKDDLDSAVDESMSREA